MEYNHEMLNTEIRNKTVGIIGLGTIGTRIAELCDNLGMKVIYWSRSPKDNKYKREPTIVLIYEIAALLNLSMDKLIMDEK